MSSQNEKSIPPQFCINYVPRYSNDQETLLELIKNNPKLGDHLKSGRSFVECIKIYVDKFNASEKGRQQPMAKEYVKDGIKPGFEQPSDRFLSEEAKNKAPVEPAASDNLFNVDPQSPCKTLQTLATGITFDQASQERAAKLNALIQSVPCLKEIQDAGGSSVDMIFQLAKVNDDLKLSNDKLVADINALGQHGNKVEAELRSKLDVDEITVKSLMTQRDNLHQQFNDKVKEVRALTKTLESLRNEADVFQNVNGEISEEKDRLEQNLDKANKVIEELEKNIESKHRIIASQDDKISTRDNEIRQLDKQLHDKTSSHDMLVSLVATKDKEADLLRGELQDWQYKERAWMQIVEKLMTEKRPFPFPCKADRAETLCGNILDEIDRLRGVITNYEASRNRIVTKAIQFFRSNGITKKRETTSEIIVDEIIAYKERLRAVCMDCNARQEFPSDAQEERKAWLKNHRATCSKNPMRELEKNLKTANDELFAVKTELDKERSENCRLEAELKKANAYIKWTDSITEHNRLTERLKYADKTATHQNDRIVHLELELGKASDELHELRASKEFTDTKELEREIQVGNACIEQQAKTIAKQREEIKTLRASLISADPDAKPVPSVHADEYADVKRRLEMVADNFTEAQATAEKLRERIKTLEKDNQLLEKQRDSNWEDLKQFKNDLDATKKQRDHLQQRHTELELKLNAALNSKAIDSAIEEISDRSPSANEACQIMRMFERDDVRLEIEVVKNEHHGEGIGIRASSPSCSLSRVILRPELYYSRNASECFMHGVNEILKSFIPQPPKEANATAPGTSN